MALWIRDRDGLFGTAVCVPVARPAAAANLGRKRLGCDDSRDGNPGPLLVDCVGCYASALWLANCPPVAPDCLFPGGPVDPVVRVSSAVPVHAHGHGALPELRHERLLLVLDWYTLPPSAFGAVATNRSVPVPGFSSGDAGPGSVCERTIRQMCGIAGLATKNSAESCLPAAARMARAMSHRGPDSHGVEL